MIDDARLKHKIVDFDKNLVEDFLVQANRPSDQLILRQVVTLRPTTFEDYHRNVPLPTHYYSADEIILMSRKQQISLRRHQRERRNQDEPAQPYDFVAILKDMDDAFLDEDGEDGEDYSTNENPIAYK